MELSQPTFDTLVELGRVALHIKLSTSVRDIKQEPFLSDTRNRVFRAKNSNLFVSSTPSEFYANVSVLKPCKPVYTNTAVSKNLMA